MSAATVLGAPPECDGRVLTVTVAGEAMAIAAADVAEVARVPPCTRIPNAPPSLCGVANLRGRVVPVVSLAALLDAEARHGPGAPQSPPAGARLLVLAGGAPVGLLVDAVASLGSVSAARALDARALIARVFAALPRAAAGRVPELPAAGAGAASGTGEGLALVGLRLGGQDYALPLDAVDRVMRVPASLIRVPRTEDAMLGTIAHDGGLLPVVSLRLLLGLPASAGALAAARIVVTGVTGVPVGLMVDGVTGTLDVPRCMIDAVPPVLLRGAAEAQIVGICRLEGGRRLVSLLAAGRLFDAETTARIGSSGQGESQRMSGADVSSQKRESFVIFRLGAEQYGLPIAAVEEVARHPESLARVPDAPDFVAGMMSLRGRALPVIDMAGRFAAAGRGRARRVIVVSVSGVTAGLAVDAVSDVLSFPLEALQPAPDLAEGDAIFDRIAMQGAERMILLISPKGMIAAAERDLLAAWARSAPPKIASGA